MQFSDSSTKTGLVEDVRFLTSTDSNSFATADITRSINRYYYKAVMAAWESQDAWDFDDANQTGFAIATTDLVNAQQDYALPSTALKIRRVEAKDSAGNWVKLEPISLEEIPVASDEFMETNAMPRFYRLERNSVMLYPKPATASVTTTNGLKIHFLREVDEFTASDTTQEPGIAEPFHRILSLGAAYDFCVTREKPQAQTLKAELEQLIMELRKFVSSRYLDHTPRIKPRRENYA